jgi:hypothetical protein
MKIKTGQIWRMPGQALMILEVTSNRIKYYDFETRDSSTFTRCNVEEDLENHGKLVKIVLDNQP